MDRHEIYGITSEFVETTVLLLQTERTSETAPETEICCSFPISLWDHLH